MLIDVTVDGITKLMLDRFHVGMVENQLPKTSNKKTDQTPLEQATAKLYLYDNDPKRPYLPVEYLQRSIIEAGRFVKIGKRQLSTRDETIVPSFLTVLGTDFPIISKEPWRIDARGIVNQVTKARVAAYRPIFDDWKISFTLDLDEREGRVDTVRELVDRAGRAIGLGVMRPSRKGTYGQFKVVKWLVKREDKPVIKIA